MENTEFLTHVLPVLALAGMLGGFLNGLLGVGGGVIFVPTLMFAFTRDMHVAVATSLATIALTGSTSVRAHHKRGGIDWGIYKKWLPFLLAGAAAGVLVANATRGAVLEMIFGVVVGLVAVYTGLSPEKPQERERLTQNAARLVSAIIGLVSAMTGVGGGAFLVALMAYSGVPMNRAAGTGTPFTMTMALMTCIAYMASGYVSLPAVLCLAPGAMFCAPFGAAVAHKIPRLLLRRIFAVVLVVVSCKMLLAP
jgi:uncharacterized membrane protein YfcA